MRQEGTSAVLQKGMESTLDAFRHRHNGERDIFYWVLRLKLAELGGGAESKSRTIPADLQQQVMEKHRAINAYFDNVRYALLDPVTRVWGTVVNAVRVASSVDTPEAQRKAFDFPLESVVSFFRAARDRMEVAESLYEAFKPMPAPDCQALAALLNVDVDLHLDAESVAGIVKLLDAEGPITEAETQALELLRNTGLISAAFRGLRAYA